ncbi:hypothetical protein MLD38_000459 [Melastoma candidum]|uniref:Uncharacterized protein n=1 Tax=Melastoma candidum TaxID=119954 RepID=A0ACB9S9H3_9MYRT|nr:hypothetical protein MLD38_000459 [Melastoma candidum]
MYTLTIVSINLTAAEGDKYKVAKRWGHIHIVTRKWLDQSIARKACLNEDSYPVPGIPVPPLKGQDSSVAALENHGNEHKRSQSFTSAFGDPYASADPALGDLDQDLETTLSQTCFPETHLSNKEDACEMIHDQRNESLNQDDRVAQDSETEDDGLYLSECRLMLVGFDSQKLRSLVNITRKGGASRYTTSNERLTHIIVGCPSESEKKEVRGLASLGLIHVVRSSWLEDCGQERREVPVLQKHIAYDLLLPKGYVDSNAEPTTVSQNTNITDYGRLSRSVSHQPVSNGEIEDKLVNGQVEKSRLDGGHCHDESADQPQQNFSVCLTVSNDLQKKQINCNKGEMFSCTVFRGKYFCFSGTFPEERRPEIVDWVNQGGGKFLTSLRASNLDYVIECHGVNVNIDIHSVTYVSSHWIRSCLEDRSLLDVGSHILYSPLSCQVPLPGFESFQFCVSQYEAKDRQLLRNLCYTLGAKFGEKLTKKVTHLLCKFSVGDKYDAACKWGIEAVTSDWISECVRQNRLVPLEGYRPKEVSAHELGSYTISQYLSQATQVRSGVLPSESLVRSQYLGGIQNSNNKVVRQELDNQMFAKKARIMEEADGNDAHISERPRDVPVCNEESIEEDKQRLAKEEADIPDVAAAIEDLLEETSKIQDKNSPERRTLYDLNIFPSKPLAVPERPEHHSLIGLSKHWINRSQRTGDAENCHHPSRNGDLYALDGFSETQTESQVVGYEEDLSGRQLIIDRVRTQSSMNPL